VLDPFGGSGTVGEVADSLSRDATIVELNAEYMALARERTAQAGLSFAAPATP
jgi:DNA modification methylase